MKKIYWMILLVGGFFLLASALPCIAEKEEADEQVKKIEDEQGDRIWEEFGPKEAWEKFKPTEEMIERVMSRLAESEPEKAKALAELRKENPEKFNEEIKKVMREDIRRMVRGREGMGGFGGYGGMGMPRREGGRGEGGGLRGREREGRDVREEGAAERRPPRRPRGYMRMSPEQEEEFMKWMGEGYPDEVEKLEGLKEKEPELYERQKHLIFMKYIWIYRAARENPELAEIFKEQRELNIQQDRLLREINRVKGGKEKEELIAQLREVLSRKFDLIVRRKRIAYEGLRKRLRELEELVRESEAKVEKWQNPEFKEQQVKARVEELVGKEKPFDWD